MRCRRSREGASAVACSNTSGVERNADIANRSSLTAADLCIAQVTLHQKRSEIGRALALSGRIVTAGWCQSCPQTELFFTRRASHASTAPRQRAFSDQSVLGDEYWCAIRRPVGFLLLSVARANLPKVGRPCALKMPRYQGLTDLVLNRRSLSFGEGRPRRTNFGLRLRRSNPQVSTRRPAVIGFSAHSKAGRECLSGNDWRREWTGIQKPLNL